VKRLIFAAALAAALSACAGGPDNEKITEYGREVAKAAETYAIDNNGTYAPAGTCEEFDETDGVDLPDAPGGIKECRVDGSSGKAVVTITTSKDEQITVP
jgi:hypothetical protein